MRPRRKRSPHQPATRWIAAIAGMTGAGRFSTQHIEDLALLTSRGVEKSRGEKFLTLRLSTSRLRVMQRKRMSNTEKSPTRAAEPLKPPGDIRYPNGCVGS